MLYNIDGSNASRADWVQIVVSRSKTSNIEELVAMHFGNITREEFEEALAKVAQ